MRPSRSGVIRDKYSWLKGGTDLGCTGSETPRPLLWDNNETLADTAMMNALRGLSSLRQTAAQRASLAVS